MKTIVSVKGSGFFSGFTSRCHQRGHKRLCPPTECTSNHDGWHRLQLPPLCMLPINSILNSLCVALWNIPILVGDFMYLFTNWVCRSILSLLNCSKKANKSVKENTRIEYERWDESRKRKVLWCSDSGRFTQLWPKHSQFRECFIPNRKNRFD